MEFSSHIIIIRKCILAGLCLILMGLVSACMGDDYTPALDSKGRRYNSQDLANDWRAKFQHKEFPADNDAEYYYPKYKYNPNGNGGYKTPIARPDPYFNNNYQDNEPSPAPYNPPVNQHNQQYPQDNDAENATGRYPRYDPEADNADLYPLLFN
jgi:hypothetical protein